MPAFQVTGPDGRKFRVDAPEGATADDAIAYIYDTKYGAASTASAEEPERTIGGYAKEALKGLVPGAAGLAETAITGAAALLPEEAEQAVRRGVSGVVEPIREAFAPAPGYEDTTVRKLSEAVGSTLPFLPLGALGAAGRAAAVGLGVGAGAGEARQRAEQEGATEGERATATALGIGPGALEALPPIRILRRFGFGDEALQEVAGFVPALRRAAQAGGEEALQEASSQVLQNLIAKGVYAPDEAVFGGVGEAAAMGGGAGAVVSAIADLALGRRLRGRGAEEAPAEEPPVEEAPPTEEIKALPAPRTGGYRVDSEGNVVPMTEAEIEEGARASSEFRALGLGEAEAIAERMRDVRARPPKALPAPRTAGYKVDSEGNVLPMTEAELEASTRISSQSRALGLGEAKAIAERMRIARAEYERKRRPIVDQMEFPLEGGGPEAERISDIDLLGPVTEPPSTMYKPAEDVLSGFRPRSRVYKEEAKDLGLRLDRKGNLKPNQFVYETPEIEVPAGQMGLDLPGIPMERLAPRDRVLRAMSITEDKKNIPNLRFATQLRPMELQKTLGDLKNEGAIAFNKSANEWELTPAGVENVRTGSPKTKPPRRRRGPSVSVPPQGAEGPDVTGTGEPGVVGAGESVARTDVGEGPSAPTLTKEEREALIRQKFQQAAARKAVDEVTERRTTLRTQAIDAFDADQISEKTYTFITDELKKPVPNFARVTSMLEGAAKPKRQGVGLKFQRAPIGSDEFKAKRQEAIEIAKGNADSAFADQTSFQDLNESIGAYQDNVRDTLQEYGLSDYEDYAINAYEARIKELTEKEIPRKQRGEIPAAPQVAPERVQAIATDTARDWANPPAIVVARNVDDPAIAQFRDQIPDDAKGFYTNGTTYVLADRAPDESSIRGTVLHESLGHYGLEQEFGARLQDEMQGIYDTNIGMQKLADARIAKDKSLTPSIAIEEILAERSEAGPIKESYVRSALNRLISFVRNYLRQKGFVSKYSDNDITQMLRRAHERVTSRKKAPYDPFDPQIRYQRSPAEQRKGDRAFINSIGKIPSSLPEATNETFQNAVDAASNVPPATRRALYSMLNPHDMDRMYRKYTNGFGELWNDLNGEGVFLRKEQDKITENIQKWKGVLDKYSPAEQSRIFKIFMDTTINQVEVLNLQDGKRNINWEAKTDSPIYKQFVALKPEVQEVYKQLRLAYLDYALGVENSLKQYLTPNEFQKLQSEFNAKRLPVYLPLFRKGKYKLKYTDRNNQTVALQFESVAERDRAWAEAKREGGKERIYSEVGSRKENEVPPSGFFGTVVATLKKNKVDPAIINPIVNAYLDLIPAQSVLQFARKRAGTAGYRENVLEAYANVGDSYARRLANMTYTPKFFAARDKIVTDLELAKSKDQIDPDVAEDIKYVLDKQMEFIQDPKLDSWAAKASYFSYQMYLGANISTAIVNTLDIPTVVWSRLGGKHGFGKAFNSILKAGTVFFSKNKSSEMQELIRRGLDTGSLREQQLQDIATFKDLDSKYERIKAGTERVTNWAFAKSDMFNRQVALAAAYDLNKKTPEGVFDENAFAQAQRTVYDVYGSSFPKASAPIMGNNIARTALTFKRFAIVRMNLLVNAYREATKDLDPNDPETKIIRDAARKELLGYFGTAFVFAGVQGMPVVGAGMVLATLLNGLFGDDDEPYNPEFELREAVGLFNYKGPINYLTGVDIASRTGWSGMFWREDPRRMAEVGPLTYTMEQILGPAYAYFNGWFRDGGAIDNFTDEKYQRGFEQILPRAASNILKAQRYAEEGALTGQGIPLVDDVNAYNIFMQIFGFRPSDVAEAGEEAGAAKRMESKIIQRRNAIIERAAIARMSGDYDGFQEAVEDARTFSQKYPNRPITGETIFNAVNRRQKKMAESVNGVRVDPKLARQIYGELGIEPE